MLRVKSISRGTAETLIARFENRPVEARLLGMEPSTSTWEDIRVKREENRRKIWAQALHLPPEATWLEIFMDRVSPADKVEEIEAKQDAKFRAFAAAALSLDPSASMEQIREALERETKRLADARAKLSIEIPPPRKTGGGTEKGEAREEELEKLAKEVHVPISDSLEQIVLAQQARIRELEEAAHAAKKNDPPSRADAPAKAKIPAQAEAPAARREISREERDERRRLRAAAELEIPPESTWSQIRYARFKQEREAAAAALSLDPDTPWDGIRASQRQRREQEREAAAKELGLPKSATWKQIYKVRSFVRK